MGNGPNRQRTGKPPVARTTIGAAENVVELLGRKPLRRLMARRDGPGLLFLGGHLALLGATGFLLARSLDTIWVVPALLLHGIIMVHLFAPFHETSHRTAFRSRWLNEGVYWLCGLVLGLMPMAFRFQHADHHTYTQDIRRDPQMIPMAERLEDISSMLRRFPTSSASQRHWRSIPWAASTRPNAAASRPT